MERRNPAHVFIYVLGAAAIAAAQEPAPPPQPQYSPEQVFRPRPHGEEAKAAGLDPAVLAKLDVELQRHVAASMGMGLGVFWGDATGEGPEHRLTDLLNAERPQRSFFWSTPEAWGKALLAAENNLSPSDSIRLLDVAERLRRQLYSTSGPVPIRYEIPAAGGVTLVVEDAQGRRVHNLISDYPRNAGAHTGFWDGRDDQGRVVAPGPYRVRGLFHKDLDVTSEFAFGTPTIPPWPTSDGRGGWLSNHCNHLAVLADDQRVWVSVPETEGPYVVVALDYDGNKLWGGAGPLVRRVHGPGRRLPVHGQRPAGAAGASGQRPRRTGRGRADPDRSRDRARSRLPGRQEQARDRDVERPAAGRG